MSGGAAARTNEQWIAVLRDTAHVDAERALGDLTRFLRGALARVLRSRGRISDDDLSDFVQETLMLLVDRLESFRGESRFTTWATAIATRVAFTELRRRASRDSARDLLELALRDARQTRSTDARPADHVVARGQLLAALDRAISTDLTERQRVAVLAELRGVPTILVAERLGTNRNALYKLTHDARRRLRVALARDGHDDAAIRDVLEEGEKR